MTFFSKTKYLAGLQCAKLLWYHYNAKEEIPKADPATQALFDQGHEVGELAKMLFPGGVEVGKGVIESSVVVARSREALALRRPLFESGFRHKNAYARADILAPSEKNRWDIVEVKSSTEVKDVNLADVAFQRYAFEGTGLEIRNCYLLHINSDYVRRGAIDPSHLFTREDVTEPVSKLLPSVDRNLKQMLGVVGMKDHPVIPIGPQCSDPYSCPLMEKCWRFLPSQNVTTMHRLGKKAFELLQSGVEKIVDIPSDYGLSDVQKIQLDATRSGRPHLEKNKIQEFLGSVEYPVHFLDFETFSTAVPLFDDVRPYQQVPFQFSLHIAPSAHSQPVHHVFLSEGVADPRPEILARLSSLIGPKGSVVGYNAGFEKRILNESCHVFQKYLPWFGSLEGRVVDLLTPFRSFHYYHPLQEGSTSLKAVLPALTGRGYEGMEIADGTAASLEFLRVTFGSAGAAERERVRRNLLEYCGLDTSGMIRIVEALRALL